MKRRLTSGSQNGCDLLLARRSVGGACKSRSVERLDNSRCSGIARRGAFFNYIMVYLTLSSVLMTAAGLCLHSVLRADSSDRREALLLSSLQRAEHQLRDDSRDHTTALVSPEELTIETDGEAIIRWQASRGILTRTAAKSGQTIASDRFVFPAGSIIEMVPGPETSIVVRVTEPSAFVTYSPSGSGGSNLNKPVEEASPATPSHVAQPKAAEIRLRGVQP